MADSVIPSRLTVRDLCKHSEASLWAQRCRVDDVCPPHDHDFVEIALILGGRGCHASPQGEQELQSGDVIVLRPGTWHSYHDCHRLDVFNCSFAVEWLHRELAPVVAHPALHYLFWAGPLAMNRQGLVALHIAEAARRQCVKYLTELARPDIMEMERLGHLMLFLGQLARAVETQVPPQSTSVGSVHPLVREGVQLLEADVARAWTLGELAVHLHVDRCHLARLFTAHTGLAPMAYLARCRAERAATLLLRTGEPIADIGRRVGWLDPNYFARRFKTHFQLSASQYREQFAPASSRI
jgi:AraC family L-rhamnose operon transcriptional activator RhaR